MEGVFDVDWMALLTREVLRERTPELIAEACAWAVGMSDQPHYLRTGGRIVATGPTVGERALTGLALSGDEDGRLDLGDARPGSFQDALNGVDRDGRVQADRFDEELLHPFVTETCLRAAERARRTRPADWAELADDVGEEEADLADVVRAGGWEAPLRIDAEHLVLAALGDVPLIEVEAEGLPLSLVRAAEAATRAAGRPTPDPLPDDALAGCPVPRGGRAGRGRPAACRSRPADAGRLLEELVAQGLEDDEVARRAARPPAGDGDGRPDQRAAAPPLALRREVKRRTLRSRTRRVWVCFAAAQSWAATSVSSVRSGCLSLNTRRLHLSLNTATYSPLVRCSTSAPRAVETTGAEASSVRSAML